MSNGNERLDRIETLLERVATFAQDERIQRVEADNQLRNAINATNQNVAQTARSMGQLSQTVGQLSEDVRSLTAEMDQLRAVMMTHLREQHNNDNDES
ncbi:MAG: hypothetical protein AAGF98_00320 [Cyanobacteria bacterium P01_H01_bin.153]